MRHVMTGWTAAAIGCGLVSLGIAGEPNASTPPQQTKVETQVKTPTSAELRAEIHRTMAALIEAQAAEEPNSVQIAELTKSLSQLRGKLRSQNPATVGNPAAGWGCPWGGPGRGPGMGRGAGFGPGRGWGGGPVGGRGMGPGAGLGLGAGSGAFVDEDHDGICDYYELRHGMHRE